MDESIGYGSADHFRRVRQRLESTLTNLRKGGKVKMARWFSFFDCAEALLNTWSSELLLLVWVGLRSGWFKQISDSPLMQVAPQPAPDQDGLAPVKPALGAEEPSRSVRDSNLELAGLRRACKNTLYVAACIPGCKRTRSQVVLLLGVAKPIRVDFGAMIVMQKTVAGTQEWACSRASGAYGETCVRRSSIHGWLERMCLPPCLLVVSLLGWCAFGSEESVGANTLNAHEAFRRPPEREGLASRL